MDNNYVNTKERAYKIALNFNKSDLKEHIIYAKLEKQGFPIDVAKEVALNIAIDREGKKDIFNYKKFALNTLGICFIISLVVFLISGNLSQALYLFLATVGLTFLLFSLSAKE